LPLPFDIRGRRYMVVADEDVYRPDRVQSNDVTVDERGLLYLTDRRRGLTIIERL
jgi:hypothetical protein